MAKSSAAGLLTSVDSMFTTQEERDNAQRSYVTDLPIAEISDFPDHPFKVRMDESMTEMVESVKERGVLSPVLVRPMPDGGYHSKHTFRIPRDIQKRLFWQFRQFVRHTLRVCQFGFVDGLIHCVSLLSC